MKKKLKIGICEFSSLHHIHVYYLIRMLKKYDNIKIYLFISNFIYENLTKIDGDIFKDIKLVCYNKKTFMPLYNYKVSKMSANFDILIVNSLIGGKKKHLEYIFLKPQCKYILIDASNGKPYLDGIKSYKGRNKIFQLLAYLISLSHLKKSDKLIYHSRFFIKEISKYLKKEKLFLPFTFYENWESKTANQSYDQIIFTITGGIQELRKDFFVFFNALSILFKDKPKLADKIKFIFLGTIKNNKNKYGKNVLKSALDYNQKYGKIIQYYNTLFIPEKEYRNVLANTDVLLNIINLDYYKKGKDSSGVGESIIYSLPGIYPKGYRLYKELKSSALFYEDANELAEIINKLATNNKVLTKLKDKSIENSNNFSINKYSKIFYDFITG